MLDDFDLVEKAVVNGMRDQDSANAFYRIKNRYKELAQQSTNKPSVKCSVPGCNGDVKQLFCNQHLGVIGLRSTSHVG